MATQWRSTILLSFVCLLLLSASVAGSGLTMSANASPSPSTSGGVSVSSGGAGLHAGAGNETVNQTIKYRRDQPKFVTVDFQSYRPPPVGDSTQLTATVTATQQVRNLSLSLQPVFGYSVTANRTALGSFSENESKDVQLTIQPEQKVERTLQIRITGVLDNQSATNRAALTLSPNTVTATSVASDSFNEYNLSQVVAGPTQSSPQLDPSTDSTSYIRGQAEYTFSGETAALPNVRVSLYDSDTASGEPEYLAQQRTNATGHFSFTLEPNEDADGDGSADVSVLIIAETPAGEVVDESRASYAYQSATATVSTGESVTLGSDIDQDGARELVSAETNAPYQALAWLGGAHEYIRQNSGNDWTRDRITIRYPSGTWPYYSFSSYGEYISLPRKGYYPWGPTTVHHEFGHAVMYATHGWSNWPGSNEYSDCHTILSETDDGFAMIEGWAEYLEVAINDDPNIYNLYGGNVETNDWHNTSYTGQCVNGDADGTMDGYRVEGSIMSLLWDLTDSPPNDDDNIDGSFSLVFDVMRTGHPETITEFYDAWYWDHDRSIDRIYTTYGVDKTAPSISSAVQNDSVYQEPSPDLSGTITDDSRVGTAEVRIDDGAWQELAITGNEWSFTPSSLSIGEYTLEVRATDKWGNQRTESWSFVVAREPATITISEESFVTRGGGAVKVPLTYTSPLTTNVTVSASNSTTTIGETTAELSAGENTHTTITLPISETAQESNYTISATLGINESASSTVSQGLRIDNTDPVLTVAAVNTTADGSVSLNGSIADASAVTVRAKTNSTGSSDQESLTTNSTYNLSVVVMTGSNTITITATDAAGNSQTQTKTVAVDGVIATDPDGDGLHEDINANGQFDIGDIQSLFNRLESTGLKNHTEKFDFNDNGRIDIGDVQSLFREYVN